MGASIALEPDVRSVAKSWTAMRKPGGRASAVKGVGAPGGVRILISGRKKRSITIAARIAGNRSLLTGTEAASTAATHAIFPPASERNRQYDGGADEG